MAYNEIILQCYVLEPVIDSTSQSLTKTEMYTEKQIIPLLPLTTSSEQQPIQSQQHPTQQLQLNQQIAVPQSPAKPLAIDIHPPGVSPSAPSSR